MASRNPTAKQKACIDSLQPKLAISAAAGTGKTFTLTQKIVHMIDSKSLQGIGDVLAITFTRKAASELVGRVRSALRGQGLHDEALRVDDAWISTIHGMCSRMLKAHALELGIDPAFEIASEEKIAMLISDAMEEAMRDGSIADDAFAFRALPLLFEEYSYSDKYSGSIRNLVSVAVNKAAELEKRSFGINIGPESVAPAALAKKIYDCIRSHAPIYEDTTDFSDSQQRLIAKRMLLADKLGELLDNIDGVDPDSFMEILDEYGDIGSAKNKKRQDFQDANKEEQELVNWACAECFAALGSHNLDMLLDFAEKILGIYEKRKRVDGLLDNSDLLVLTRQCLKNHPEFAQTYKEQFRLIMVDEFQDTDETQIDIFSEILDDDNAQLCTVGDAQQSIYRFRGADIAVFEKFIDGLGVDPMELDENFRSHEDILHFSNKVFEQPHVFGKRFLRMKSGVHDGDEEIGGLPRLSVAITKKVSGSISEARQFEAAAIADRFAKLKAAGCKPGDMVVLLGAMSNLDIYTKALEARGLSVIVAGGSKFWESDEAKLVANLVSLLANPQDSSVAYEYLNSPLFDIGQGEISMLAVDGEGKRTDMIDAFFGAGEGMPESLLFAKRIMDAGLSMVRHDSIANILSSMISESGYAERLNREGGIGVAKFANILKAIRQVENYELIDGYGLAQISVAMRNRIEESGKDGVGVLYGGQDDSVRIMTIHASKGLEFKHVALAAFSSSTDGNRNSDPLCIVKHDGKMFATLNAGKTKDRYPVVKKLAGKYSPCFDSDPRSLDPIYATSQSDYSLRLRELDAREECKEADRRLYVGITRASQSLMVAACCSKNKDGQDSVKPGTVLDDFRSGLFGENPFPDENCDVDFGGTEPAEYRCIVVGKNDDGKMCRIDDPSYELPQCPEPEIDLSVPVCSAKPDYVEKPGTILAPDLFFSYSSISHGGEKNQEDGEIGELEASGVDAQDQYRNGVAVELGLAFHAVCEYMALNGLLSGKVGDPGIDRVNAIAESFDLTEEQRARLIVSVATWLISDVASKASKFDHVRPEVPFCLNFPTSALPGKDARLFGEIDLLCHSDSSNAYILDYKTGGFEGETPEELLAKHRTQALCYAYAVLKEGFSSVDLTFVRIERVLGNGQPQTVSYHFESDELDEIESDICKLFESSMLES